MRSLPTCRHRTPKILNGVEHKTPMRDAILVPIASRTMSQTRYDAIVELSSDKH
jgi:hypothetical protein